MYLRYITFVLVLFTALSCAKDDPEPEKLVCVEGEFTNEEGAIYYVECPDLGNYVCVKTFRFKVDVNGNSKGTTALLTIRSITPSTVEKVERIVGLHNQRFEMNIIHESSIPTTHNVSLIMPAISCSVNMLEGDFYMDVDEPCGSTIDIVFNVDCE